MCSQSSVLDALTRPSCAICARVIGKRCYGGMRRKLAKSLSKHLVALFRGVLIPQSGRCALVTGPVHQLRGRGTLSSCPGQTTMAKVVESKIGSPCRLPATWDQLMGSLASGMGPPALPVVGPP